MAFAKQSGLGHDGSKLIIDHVDGALELRGVRGAEVAGRP